MKVLCKGEKVFAHCQSQLTTDQLTTTTVLCESDFCALPIDTLRKIDHFLLMELRLIFLRAVHTTFMVKLKFSELCPVNLHHED